jgi:arsenate reductase-like glutaredoxin family protein
MRLKDDYRVAWEEWETGGEAEVWESVTGDDISSPPMPITVYEKRTCTTCRKLAELLTERGIDFERVEYHVERLTEPEIRELLGKAGITARDALRMREEGAAKLAATAGEDEIVARSCSSARSSSTATAPCSRGRSSGCWRSCSRSSGRAAMAFHKNARIML